MKNGSHPPALLQPGSNQYLIGSGQFLRGTLILLIICATALSTRTSINLSSYTSKYGIQVRKLEHFSSAHEPLKIKQKDTDIAISLAKTGSGGKEHRAQLDCQCAAFPPETTSEP